MTESAPNAFADWLNEQMDPPSGVRRVSADLARVVGVSSQTVGRWRRGSALPSAADLSRIVVALDVPADERAAVLALCGGAS